MVNNLLRGVAATPQYLVERLIVRPATVANALGRSAQSAEIPAVD
jgi:hypothetical protein